MTATIMTPHMQRAGSPPPYITLEKAQEIALTQANVPAEDGRV